MTVALVTGSGKRRVGWHVADALAARGYALAVHYHTSAAAAEESAGQFRKHGGRIITVQADLADEAAVVAMIRRVLDTLGRIDVLVNCAAVWERKRLEDVVAADVRRNFDINALGTFLCCQHAGLAMVEQPEGGSIVTVGDWAVERPYLDHLAYFVSKGAIPALTRAFAVELGTRNPRVRVNCIHPGPVMLPPDLTEEERRQSIAGTLVKREGRPENVAQAVLALVENDFITGACVPVDGGRTVYAPEFA